MKFRPSSLTLLTLSIGSLMTSTGALKAGWILIPDLTTGGTASGSPADFPLAETPPNAFDDNAFTKGLIFNDVANDNASPYEDVTSVSPVIWTYAFAGGAQHTVGLYSLTSANDAEGRDPRDFFLEGSNDGSAWVIVDAVTGHQFFDQPGVGDNSNLTNRFETYYFGVDTPGSYSQYRLRVVETFGTTDDRPQIADIQMFVPEPGAAGLMLFTGALVLARRRPGRERK
jgi:hypothetical protein